MREIILDTLHNARTNFETIGEMVMMDSPIYAIAMNQLNAAITEIEKDKLREERS